MSDGHETPDDLVPDRASPAAVRTHDDVVAAARAELEAAEEEVRVVPIGRAVEDPAGRGVFRVAAPSRDLTEMPPGELFLAPPTDQDERSPVGVHHASPTEAVVALIGEPPVQSTVHLHIEIDPTLIPKALTEYLEKCKKPGLAATMLDGNGLRGGPSVPDEELNPEQQEALGAIAAPGVAAVWGPPGTGKTRVIGTAVTRLLRSGQTVAVVSNTNVAVDQAILHVARAAGTFRPGEILRVGNPTIPEVSDHSHLVAGNAVLVRHEDIASEVSRLQEEIDEIRAATAPEVRRRIGELLAGHDAGSLADLLRRREQAGTLDHPDLSDDERELASHIDRCGSVDALLAERRSPKRATRKARSEINRLLGRIEDCRQRLEGLEDSVVAGARVLGTTLAQLVLHRGLIGRSFDHVIIDEASAALPPYVYAAMTKARIGCTLIGDFEQNWPISRCDDVDITAATKPWLRSDPFSLLGIRSAADALHTEGCVTLRAQYRFGEATMRLANSITYRGQLRHGRAGPPASDGPEIVVVDTSGLEEAGAAQRGPGGGRGWWAAGAALAYGIALRHGFEGVGVITPYRFQAQLSRAHVNGGGGLAVQVGTAHAFQGREFPVVVLDLVEDGDGGSWVARARRSANPWSRAGLRLFNVAVTRNAGHLFVVSNAETIRTARGGPLRELATLIRTGSVATIDARGVLDDDLASLSTPFKADQDAAFGVPEILGAGELPARFEADAIQAGSRVVVVPSLSGAGAAMRLAGPLSQAVARGLQARVVVAPGDGDEPALESLRDLGVEIRDGAAGSQDVVIVDDHTCYVGRFDSPSAGGIMLRLGGTDAVAQIARWVLSSPR